MKKTIRFLILPLLCVTFYANATYQLVARKDKAVSVNSKESVTLSQDAVDYLYRETKEIISRHKTGVNTLGMSVLSETGNVVPNEDDLFLLSFVDNEIYPLDLNLEFGDVSIEALAIENITYKDAEFMESIYVPYISLLGKQGERVRLNQDKDGITIILDYEGYQYKLSETKELTLKIKKRKKLVGKNDGIFNPQSNPPVSLNKTLDLQNNRGCSKLCVRVLNHKSI